MVGIENRGNPWVVEDGRALFKADTMFLEIATGFLIVPFKLKVFHAQAYFKLYRLAIIAADAANKRIIRAFCTIRLSVSKSRSPTPSNSAPCSSLFLRAIPSKKHHHTAATSPAAAWGLPSPIVALPPSAAAAPAYRAKPPVRPGPRARRVCRRHRPASPRCASRAGWAMTTTYTP